jgi:large subunit ribosomal protein L19
MVLIENQFLNNLENQYRKLDLPRISIGDGIKVGIKIIEGNKERIQFYEGTVISKKNSSVSTIITVRKILYGIGTERSFLLHSPKITHLEIIRSSKVRRSKLYYLRSLSGKATQLEQYFNE